MRAQLLPYLFLLNRYAPRRMRMHYLMYRSVLQLLQRQRDPGNNGRRLCVIRDKFGMVYT